VAAKVDEAAAVHHDTENGCGGKLRRRPPLVQMPRKSTCRQQYEAYAARVNPCRFCRRDQWLAVLLQSLRRFGCKCHHYNPADWQSSQGFACNRPWRLQWTPGHWLSARLVCQLHSPHFLRNCALITCIWITGPFYEPSVSAHQHRLQR